MCFLVYRRTGGTLTPMVEPAPVEARPASLPGETPALRLISEGDRAWFAGDRGAAQAAWRAALSVVAPTTEPVELSTGADAAAEALTRLRLLQVEGNLAPIWHERALNAALARCPDVEAWCQIARADYHLWMPTFTGADPKEALRLLAPGGRADAELPGPAAARRLLAGSGESLAAFPESGLDGFAAGLKESGGLPADPGTWVLGLGVAAAPGLGIGASVHFDHPDLAWKDHDLRLDLAASSRGAVALSASAFGASRGRPRLWVGLSSGPVDRYDPPLTAHIGSATLGAGAGAAGGGGAAALGLVARVDQLDEPDAVAETLGRVGPWIKLGAGPVGLWAETGFGSYVWINAGASLKWVEHWRGWELAAHGVGELAPIDGGPWWMLPSAGGAHLLRGLPAGRYRDPLKLGAQAELRHDLVGPLRVAAFVDGAALGPLERWDREALHITAGLGLRLVLPPEKQNITRLDVGFGEGRVGVVLGWGEAW